jgi:hypothetical protein
LRASLGSISYCGRAIRARGQVALNDSVAGVRD